MSIIYSLIGLCIMLFLAWWESELIKRGESNHVPKLIFLILCLVLLFTVHYEQYTKKVFIVIGILTTMYFSMYDYIINFIRKVPDPMNYKLFGKPWMKFVSLLLCVFLTIYYFFV